MTDAYDEQETPVKRRRGRPPGVYGKYRPRAPDKGKLNPLTDLLDDIYSAPDGTSKPVQRLFGNLAIEARRYADMALNNLVQLAQHAKNEGVRLNATLAILDRGYGRPMQSLDLKTDGPVVQVNMFEGINTEDQRLAAEVLGAIQNNPAALSLAIDVMNDPAAMTVTVPDDVLDLEAAATDIIDAEVVDLTPEPVE
jgi:hypothetical protein